MLASIFGVVDLLYIPAHFIVPGDAAATASKIRASELLFRAGIVSELIGFTLFIFVVLVLHRLFKGISKKYASLMVILMLLSIPNIALECAERNRRPDTVERRSFFVGLRPTSARCLGNAVPQVA